MTWAHPLGAAVGVALMASPGVLDYGGAAATSSWIVGPLAASVGFLASFEITRSLRFLNLPLGLWLLAAPVPLGFPADALGASVAAAALLVPIAFVRGDRKRPYGGGWRSLFD